MGEERAKPLLKFIEKLSRGGKVVKCPYCGYEEEFRFLRAWKFRFYDVKMLECPNCKSVFNHYYGISPRTRKEASFTIKIKPRKG